MENILQVYSIEKVCEYRGEVYHVRDNGSIFRCRRPDERKRPLDNKWTFGNPNKQSGYMDIASETVHRIVATAFHGHKPSEKHVVDHIDTNRRNNRPENLRWITKLENILKNPITLQRIIFSYGSLDKFFENPYISLFKNRNPNFNWMRTVTKEEAENALANLLKWSEQGTIPKGGVLEDWIFTKKNGDKISSFKEDIIIESLTPHASQINWKTPSNFPNCPKLINEKSLIKYRVSLKKGSIFSSNQYGESIVLKSDIYEKTKHLIVLTKSENIKPFALAKVYQLESVLVHENLGSFFKIDGAEKEYGLALGQEWEGGETFDELVS